VVATLKRAKKTGGPQSGKSEEEQTVRKGQGGGGLKLKALYKKPLAVQPKNGSNQLLGESENAGGGSRPAGGWSKGSHRNPKKGFSSLKKKKKKMPRG